LRWIGPHREVGGPGAGGIGHGEAWLGLVFVEQAFAEQVRRSARNIEQSELDAGGASIQDKDSVGHHRYS
jgi:hypothetical protein